MEAAANLGGNIPPPVPLCGAGRAGRSPTDLPAAPAGSSGHRGIAAASRAPPPRPRSLPARPRFPLRSFPRLSRGRDRPGRAGERLQPAQRHRLRATGHGGPRGSSPEPPPAPTEPCRARAAASWLLSLRPEHSQVRPVTPWLLGRSAGHPREAPQALPATPRSLPPSTYPPVCPLRTAPCSLSWPRGKGGLNAAFTRRAAALGGEG